MCNCIRKRDLMGVFGPLVIVSPCPWPRGYQDTVRTTRAVNSRTDTWHRLNIAPCGVANGAIELRQKKNIYVTSTTRHFAASSIRDALHCRPLVRKKFVSVPPFFVAHTDEWLQC